MRKARNVEILQILVTSIKQKLSDFGFIVNRGFVFRRLLSFVFVQVFTAAVRPQSKPS